MSAALDRLDRLAASLRAVSDLLIPERDLHAVDREAQTALVELLAAEAAAVRHALSAERPTPDA